VQADLETEGYKILPFLLPASGVGDCPHRRDRVWFIAYSDGARKRKYIGTNNKEAENVWWKKEVDVSKQLFDFRSIANPTIEERFKHKTDWRTFPNEHPVCGRNDGLSERLDGITFSKWKSETIKSYGNSIVPQLAHEIFKIIDIMNK
jgi:DNA (cytosine-5)-methyltransferase 1